MDSKKSLLDEMASVKLAIELIELGARLQVIESETEISRPRLVRLYKEIRGISPPKGLLPFSTDWFMTWLPNIHASLFYNIYLSVNKCSDKSRMDNFIRSYKLYQEQIKFENNSFELSLTRAWTLIRFFESSMLELCPCCSCKGLYVTHSFTPSGGYVCGICQPPSRAGKTLKNKKDTKVCEETI